MYVNFIGSLVRKEDLAHSQNGQPYVRFTVVRNYSKKMEDGSYEEVGSFFENFILFGKKALCFAQSNIPNGTRLSINGFTSCRKKPSYKNKDGIQVPEETVEEITVDNIAVLIDYKQTVSVDKADYASIEVASNAAPIKSTTTTKSKVAPKNKKEVKTEEVDVDDIFATDTSDSITADDSAIFDDSNSVDENEADDMFENGDSSNDDADIFDDINSLDNSDTDDIFEDGDSSSDNEDEWDIFK